MYIYIYIYIYIYLYIYIYTYMFIRRNELFLVVPLYENALVCQTSTVGEILYADLNSRFLCKKEIFKTVMA